MDQQMHVYLAGSVSRTELITGHRKFTRMVSIKTIMWYDKQRVPVVRFSALKGFPHAYTPENAWMTWDEYFCKFKRKRDGSVEYLG